MAFARAQVRLERVNQIPADDIINVTHWLNDDTVDTAAAAPELASRLIAFYQVIDSFLTDDIFSGAGDVKVYDLADPEPRIPVYEEAFVIVPTLGVSFPGEVALVVSFQAPPLSGVSQARRRGRVYLGPFTSDISQSLNGDIRPTAADITVIGNAFVVMAQNASAGAMQLAIFSPTSFAVTGVLATSIVQATEVWIDNAFDTQRRRGAQPDARTTFPI